MTKTITLIGTELHLLHSVPWDDKDMEFWGVNNAHLMFNHEKFHAWFQIHTLGRCKALPYHWEWLKEEHDFPIYMQEKYDFIPSAERFPIEDCLEVSKYLTNSFSMMLAMIISRLNKGEYKSLEEIRFYGISFEAFHEWLEEKPSCEYFMGRLEGMGIRIWVSPKCGLLKTHILYGYETEGESKIK